MQNLLLHADFTQCHGAEIFEAFFSHEAHKQILLETFLVQEGQNTLVAISTGVGGNELVLCRKDGHQTEQMT